MTERTVDFPFPSGYRRVTARECRELAHSFKDSLPVTSRMLLECAHMMQLVEKLVEIPEDANMLDPNLDPKIKVAILRRTAENLKMSKSQEWWLIAECLDEAKKLDREAE